MLFQVLQPIRTRCNANDSEEGCVERLPIGEAHHVADFFHAEILITFVNEQRHCIIDTIFVDERGVVHVEPDIDDRRDIPGVCSKILSEFLGGIILVTVLLFHHNNVHDLNLNDICTIDTDLAMFTDISHV